MRKNLYWLFLTTVFILSMAMASVGTASPEEPVIRLEPHDNTAEVGETFTVNITVTGITEEENLYGWECVKIAFNPDIINAVNVTEGPFLRDTGYSTQFLSKIDNTAGTVRAYAIFELPFPPTGASGSGTLATIIFKVVGQGPTGLDFVVVEKDDTVLQTTMGEPPYQNNSPIVHTAVGGFFNNGGPPIPLYIAGIVVIIAVFTVAVFYFWRKRA